MSCPAQPSVPHIRHIIHTTGQIDRVRALSEYFVCNVRALEITKLILWIVIKHIYGSPGTVRTTNLWANRHERIPFISSLAKRIQFALNMANNWISPVKRKLKHISRLVGSGLEWLEWIDHQNEIPLRWVQVPDGALSSRIPFQRVSHFHIMGSILEKVATQSNHNSSGSRWFFKSKQFQWVPRIVFHIISCHCHERFGSTVIEMYQSHCCTVPLTAALTRTRAVTWHAMSDVDSLRYKFSNCHQ